MESRGTSPHTSPHTGGFMLLPECDVETRARAALPCIEMRTVTVDVRSERFLDLWKGEMLRCPTGLRSTRHLDDNKAMIGFCYSVWNAKRPRRESCFQTYHSGQPFSRAHCRTSKCPPSAALVHVLLSHGQPFARTHCSISRCPPNTAPEHVPSSHGQPFSRNAFNSSSCPLNAATAQRYS